MPLTKISATQAEVSLKKLTTDIVSLNPSALIQLFEIDLYNVLNEKGLDYTTFATARGQNTNEGQLDADSSIFRFHNTVKLKTTSIFFDSFKDGVLREFIAAPIEANGFDVSSRGQTATPKLSLTVSDEGLISLSLLKDIIRSVGGDLSGAKVTRIRTLAKYLAGVNFPGVYTGDVNPDEDKFVEFPRDIYYIDRKSNENKNAIEFELASLLDLENIDLPLRKIIFNRCVWTYRSSEGCRYSGVPVADIKDEKFTESINAPLVNKGKWVSGQVYQIGNYAYIERTIGGAPIPFYFVSKINNNTDVPTNTSSWKSDVCSKGVQGCGLRFRTISQGYLPFGGFPGGSRLVQG